MNSCACIYRYYILNINNKLLSKVSIVVYVQERTLHEHHQSTV